MASARRRRPESAARRRGSRRIRAHPRRHVRTGSVGSGRRPAALPAARDVCRAGARFHHRPRWRSPDVGADARKRQQRAGGRRRGARRAAHRGRRNFAVPWFGLRGLFGASRPRELQAVLDAAAGMAAMPIVTVNLSYDRPVMQEVFAGLPGRTMQWVFDKRIAFGESASHLSLVSSGATEIVAMTNEELSGLQRARSKPRCPGARSMADSRDGRAREAGDVFAGARSATASGHADRRRRVCFSPATGPTPVCLRPSKGRSSAGIGRRPP